MTAPLTEPVLVSAMSEGSGGEVDTSMEIHRSSDGRWREVSAVWLVTFAAAQWTESVWEMAAIVHSGEALSQEALGNRAREVDTPGWRER